MAIAVGCGSPKYKTFRRGAKEPANLVYINRKQDKTELLKLVFIVFFIKSGEDTYYTAQNASPPLPSPEARQRRAQKRSHHDGHLTDGYRSIIYEDRVCPVSLWLSMLFDAFTPEEEES